MNCGASHTGETLAVPCSGIVRDDSKTIAEHARDFLLDNNSVPQSLWRFGCPECGYAGYLLEGCA